MRLAHTGADLYKFCVASYQSNKLENSYGNFKDYLMWNYFCLITTMAYELIASRQSSLLSLLCAANKIEYKPVHFSISTDDIGQQFNFDAHIEQNNYDLYPIVQSLQAFFQNNFDEFRNVYMNNASFLFHRWPLGTFREEIPTILETIDVAILELKGKTDPQQSTELMNRHDQQKDQIASLEQQLSEQKQEIEDLKEQRNQQAVQIKSQEKRLADQNQQLENLKQQLTIQRQPSAAHKKSLSDKNIPAGMQSQCLEENKLPLEPEPVELISQEEEPNPVNSLPFSERVKVFARKRQNEDEEILRKIQHLRNDLQSGLQEIAKIREGIEFETLRESISQVLAIHDLLGDTLECHPMEDSVMGYDNLIDCCHELQKNIVEALAMLGVTCIDQEGIPYAPDMHRTPPGVRPARNAMITRVLRPGFSYRSKTLEKAVVELQ